MAVTPEQLGVVTQVVQTGLHQYMESMKPGRRVKVDRVGTSLSR